MSDKRSKQKITRASSAVAGFALALMLLLCSACSSDAPGGQTAEPTAAPDGSTAVPDGRQGVKIAPSRSIDDVSVQDDRHVYRYDDEDSVVSMYLTVYRGNGADGTDHSWQEVNTYSIYDYEKMGVDRYKVEGLLQVGDEKGPLPGELGFGNRAPNAIVQIHGSSTTKMAQKSYKISLKETAGDWRQQRVIVLNKHVYDGLRLRNKLAFDLLKQTPNLFSLRTQFVRLYVRDMTKPSPDNAFEDYGLFTQIEQPNKRFLKNHGLDTSGQLYKATYFEFYRYEDALVLKNDPTYDVKKFEERLEIKGSDDHKKLIGMLDAVNDITKPIEETFETYFDADNYFTWLAFNILLGDVDTQSQNFLLYSPLNGKKWYFISWDCDGILSRFANAVADDQKDVGYECGISNYWGAMLHNRVLRVPLYREMLDKKISELRILITPQKIKEMAASYYAVTSQYIDRMPDEMYAPYEEGQAEQVLDSLPQELEKNYQYYLESLKKPLPFYVAKPQIREGKLSFEWDAAYDLDGEDITYTFELAKDYLFQDPLVKQEGLRIPATTAGLPAEGQYFFRIVAQNESGETQTAMTFYESNEKRYYGVSYFYLMPGGEVVGAYE